METKGEAPKKKDVRCPLSNPDNPVLPCHAIKSSRLQEEKVGEKHKSTPAHELLNYYQKHNQTTYSTWGLCPP